MTKYKSYIIKVPEDLWNDFKKTITLGDGSINNVIVQMIRERVEKSKQIRERSEKSEMQGKNGYLNTSYQI